MKRFNSFPVMLRADLYVVVSGCWRGMWGEDKKEGRLIRDRGVMQGFLEGLTKAGGADKALTPLPSTPVWGAGNGGGGRWWSPVTRTLMEVFRRIGKGVI